VYIYESRRIHEETEIEDAREMVKLPDEQNSRSSRK
jgi:hypothetical protein